MAVTSYVHGSMPSSLLPRIEGSNSFRRQIRDGFNYLWDEAPKWFWYVVDNVRSIGPSPPGEERSTARGSTKHVTIFAGHLPLMMERASVLVHEACHMVQFDRGERIRWFDLDGFLWRAIGRPLYAIYLGGDDSTQQRALIAQLRPQAFQHRSQPGHDCPLTGSSTHKYRPDLPKGIREGTGPLAPIPNHPLLP